MSPKDRAYYDFPDPGVHPPPQEDLHLPTKTCGTEKAEQSQFWNWLCLNSYVDGVIWHRTDKATGATLGTPDFVVPLFWGPERVLYIEFKLPGNWLSKAQEEFRTGLENKNHALYVCYSADEAIALVKQKDRLL